MRKLTEEEVAKECQQIRERPWPEGDRIWLKNLYEGRAGARLLKDAKGEIFPKVVEEAGAREYGSLEEMVRAGWVVD